jgi:hypothetical protein
LSNKSRGVKAQARTHTHTRQSHRPRLRAGIAYLFLPHQKQPMRLVIGINSRIHAHRDVLALDHGDKDIGQRELRAITGEYI